MARKNPKKKEGKDMSREDTTELPKVRGKDTRRLADLVDMGVDSEDELNRMLEEPPSEEVDDYVEREGSWQLQQRKPEGKGYKTDSIVKQEPERTTDPIGRSERGRTSTRKTHPVDIGNETAMMLEQIPFKYNQAMDALDDENRGTILPLLKKVEDYLARREYKDAVLGIGEIETSYIGDMPEGVQAFIEHVKNYVERLDKI